MPRHSYAPDALRHGPFTRAAALAAGLTTHQLESECWVRLFPEVWVHSAVALTHGVRLDALRLAASKGAIVTGRSAAWLFGAWEPPPNQPLPLEIAYPKGGTRFRGSGAVCQRLVLDDGDVDEYNGIAVTTPERTCFGLMTRETQNEATVWADAFLFKKLVTADGLLRYADERPLWPHVRKIRAALGRARAGSASPMESRLRLVIVDGGLPEPSWLNKAFHDPTGVLLAIVDMGYDVPLFGIEYDSLYHEEAEQHAADNRRENGLLVGADFPLLRYNRFAVYREQKRICVEVRAMLAKAG